MDGFNNNDQSEDSADILLGCAPLYPPLELFHSLGITPQVLWGFKDTLFDLAESDRHLQNYACSVARCLTQYVLIADEVEQHVANGVYPVPDEKYRLLWDGIAPWHQLENMFLRLADLDANIICSPYTSCMGTREGTFKRYGYDGVDPLAYLARTQNNSWCPYGLELRTRAISGLEKNGLGRE